MTSVEVVTKPGIYEMPNETYQDDPVTGGSLSSSGARHLLPPYCPALFKWQRENGRPSKRTFDFGHAAHKLVLGAGEDLVVVDAGDWRTKAAREAKEAAYAAGQVPVLVEEYAQVEAMATALLEHPYASALFAPGTGEPEKSLVWQDPKHGIWRRARLDWLPASTEFRMVLADYKTAVSAEPEAVQRAIANYGYHQQAAWYIDGVTALGLADDPAFLFVMQEKTAPYLITVVEPDRRSLAIGRHLNDQAMELYAQCVATDTWPAYTDDVTLISLPPWVLNNYQEVS